jgi:hypothetical protein
LYPGGVRVGAAVGHARLGEPMTRWRGAWHPLDRDRSPQLFAGKT